jgi:biopolymer transport protein ExbB
MFLIGGVFMWPLLITLIITLVITIERGLYWLKIKYENSYDARKSLLSLRPTSLDEVKQPYSDQAARLAFEAIEKSQLSQTQIDNLLKQKQFAHYRFMRILDVIISVAPLLGILGTIWGIINSFNLAGAVADIEPSTAMIGISEAFITTAFGLIVSLAALFSYNYFQSLSENELMTNDIFLTKLLVKLNRNE